MRQWNKINGFSLVEITIALALGLMLLAGVGEVYLSCKATYREQSRLATLQETGRIASYILQNAICTAGYHLQHGANAVTGFTSTNVPSQYHIKPVSGSDVVAITKATKNSTKLMREVNKGARILYVIKNPATKNADKLVIFDCAHSEIVISKSFGKHRIVIAAPLKYSYKKIGTEVVQFERIAYFIGASTSTCDDKAANYGLFQKRISYRHRTRSCELISNVCNMQIKYGADINNNGKVDSYYSAQQVEDAKAWSRVLAVAIKLFLQAGKGGAVVWPVFISLKERLS